MITPHGDPLGKLGEPDTGGQCVYVKELSEWLSRKGAEVDIFTRQRGGKKSSEKINDKVKLIRIDCGPEGFIPKELLLPYLPDFTDRVTEFVKEKEYSIIHTHYWDGGYVGLSLGKRAKFGWVHTSHSLGLLKAKSVPGEYENRVMVEKRVYDETDAIVATTMIEKRDIADLYGVQEEKIEVIPIGVNTEFFRYKKGAKKMFDKEFVFSLGRMDPRKGLDLLVKAMPYGNFFVIISADDPNGKLRSIAKELNVESRLEVIPPIERKLLPLYYSAADVFVLPSPYEPFGITLLEAMACRCAPIATKFGGPAEIIEDNVNGLLVDPKDSFELGNKITTLIEDREKRKKIAQNSYRRVVSRFSWDKVSDSMIELYRRIV